MRRIRSQNTRPELLVRSAFHRQGFRFRLVDHRLPGRPDIVLPKWRTIVFVHGCYWHQHERCVDGRLPKTKRGYWVPKLARNVERDSENRRDLRRLGFRVFVIWECEAVKPDVLAVKVRLINQKIRRTAAF